MSARFTGCPPVGHYLRASRAFLPPSQVHSHTRSLQQSHRLPLSLNRSYALLTLDHRFIFDWLDANI